MSRSSKTFGSLWLLALVVALGGFQCPRTAPPIPSGVQCQTKNDSSEMIQTISWNADSLVETTPTAAKPDAPASTVLTVRGQLYLSVQVAVDRKSNLLTATTRFGKAFSGMREMVLTTVDGETFSGTLDGKQFKPFVKKATPQRFADGSPLPAVSVDENTQKELVAFLNAVKDAPDACKGKSAALNRPLYADAVLPHSYDRIEQPACIACVAACITIATTCGVAVVEGCTPLCGGGPYGAAACALCFTIGFVTCFAVSRMCRFGCLNGSACCPTACGTNCCGVNETCLPPLNSCCPADHPQGCGTVCCLATDQCSAATSTCCAPGTTICGSQCCPGACDVPSGQCCPLGASTCSVCGSLGQQCCPGRVCASGTGCSRSSNTCVTCPPASQTLVNTVQHIGGNFFGNDAWFQCQAGSCIPVGSSELGAATVVPAAACDPGFVQGTCAANRSSPVNNGSSCLANWNDAQSCSCKVHILTPSNINASVDCSILVTETSVTCP